MSIFKVWKGVTTSPMVSFTGSFSNSMVSPSASMKPGGCGPRFCIRVYSFLTSRVLAFFVLPHDIDDTCFLN
ncbi:hypothetical protein EYF80_048389 [Liparis tanakae]|uniref:Uncharacterized protein n=1 Tax=Liparis tanakae TaxID=230148 RepID=A0A4Z2FKF7_9TELE|nr:hypothetical protein EYF80_048389 [Liparis tanakae]